MMESQSNTVKLVAQRTNLFTQFPKELASVTLMCEGQAIKVHKEVLAISSPYFHGLLSQSRPVIILKNFKHKMLQYVVDFMYEGSIIINKEDLPDLLDTAKVLQVKGLSTLAEGHLAKSPAPGEISNEVGQSRSSRSASSSGYSNAPPMKKSRLSTSSMPSTSGVSNYHPRQTGRKSFSAASKSIGHVRGPDQFQAVPVPVIKTEIID